MSDNLKFAYLVKVEAGANNNKYYRMTEQGDGTFLSEFGRIGAKPQTKIYNMSSWNDVYKKKTIKSKGYEDQTRFVAEQIVKETTKYKAIPSKIVAEIVARLQRMANKAIEDNYTVSSSSVTQEMIDEASKMLELLMKSTDTLDIFNEVLLELFKIIPRKMKTVRGAMLKDLEQASNMIQAEQDLLDVMRGQVSIKSIEEKDVDKVNKTILELLGLEIKPTTQADVTIIKKELGGIKDKYNDSWRVQNIKTQKAFDGFIKSENIKDIRLLWHGTRSENVWSILQSGLMLRPNASITGKMFGFGIYFAPKARKSMGYTSLSGSYWTRGGANTGYMMLFDVAYGEPYNVHSFNSRYSNLTYKGLQQFQSGSHCLHAHESKGMLRNDEIIVYKENQLTVKYLVELRN